MITSNQKDVLFENIKRHIKHHGVRSLLDIGAGDGDLAERINTVVEEYQAVEKDLDRSKHLKENGVSVYQGTFPDVEVSGTYDMVLLSHSIPEAIADVERYVEKAWDLAAPGGMILIITFKGGRGDEYQLSQEVEMDGFSKDDEIFQECLRILSRYGKPSTEKVQSTTCSGNREEMVEQIAFMLSIEKDREKQKVIEELIEEKKNGSGEYCLRHEHLFISLKRQ